MQINRFATFNRKLLRAQYQRLNSIRNLNKQHEIGYHKQFNNNFKEVESVVNELKIIGKNTRRVEVSIIVVQFQILGALMMSF